MVQLIASREVLLHLPQTSREIEQVTGRSAKPVQAPDNEHVIASDLVEQSCEFHAFSLRTKHLFHENALAADLPRSSALQPRTLLVFRHAHNQSARCEYASKLKTSATEIRNIDGKGCPPTSAGVEKLSISATTPRPLPPQFWSLAARK
jgi:hypothetical protein